MEKLKKDKHSMIRINGIVKDYMKSKGISPQKLVNEWIDKNVTLNKLTKFINMRGKNGE